MANTANEAPSGALHDEELPPSKSRIDKLYDRCAEAPAGTVFFQRELSSWGVADTLTELTALLQELVDRHLMKLMTFDNEVCWKLRTRDDAEK
jgi:DNA-directed RNA polymerase III subunit RPC6